MRPLARRLLLWTAALPLGLAALLSVWRLGADTRAHFAHAAVLAADSAAAQVWRTVIGPQAGGLREDWSARVAALLPALGPAGFELSLYRLSAGDAPLFQPVRPAGAAPPADVPPLDSREAASLLSLDRAFVSWAGRGAAGLAPIKDADQWDVVGAVAAWPVGPAPTRLPPVPLAGAILAAFATAGLAWRARAGSPGGALLLLGPSAVFLATLLAFAEAPGPASFRFWSLTFFAPAAGSALIGASLASTSSQPLRTREGARAWLFLAPSFAHLLLFSIGPIFFALFLSFHEWNLLDADRNFVGLGNYAELLRDAPFWRAVRNTAVYVLFVPVGMSLGLGLALLLDRGLPGVRVLRAIVFLPYVTSFVAISLVWKWMFEPDVGLLNSALRAIGLPAQPWLSSPATALPSLMLMSVWMYAGYMMVLFLAGLQSIPESLYESARIDGAGAWQRFRRITLPLLKPTLFFVLVTMVIFMFQVFTAVYVMTEGGPLHATDVIVYHIYRNAWEYLRMGYASAMAWVLFALVFAVTLVQFRWLGRTRPQ